MTTGRINQVTTLKGIGDAAVPWTEGSSPAWTRVHPVGAERDRSLERCVDGRSEPASYPMAPHPRGVGDGRPSPRTTGRAMEETDVDGVYASTSTSDLRFSEQKSSQRPSIHQNSPKNGRLTESPHPICRGYPPWTLEQKGSDHGRSGLSYGL